MRKTGIIVCEESQEVCKAFRARSINMYSCDLLPCSGGHPEWHLQGDLFEQIKKLKNLTFVGAHPPCTFLANSGVGRLYNEDGSINKQRWESMREGAYFFKTLIKLIQKVGKGYIENPILHRHALKIIGEMPSQLIQPYQYGHPETKATYLWVYGIPLLRPTYLRNGREHNIIAMGGGKKRAFLRSKTYPGIAAAMAMQWSNKII